MLAAARHPGGQAADCAGASPADAGQATFAVSELVREFRVTPRTLRFYGSRGFLAPDRIGASRRYSQEDHDRVAFILQAKRLGFTLREIGELMASRPCSPGALKLSREECTEQINLLERQKRTIEQALTELRQVYSSHYLLALALGDTGND